MGDYMKVKKILKSKSLLFLSLLVITVTIYGSIAYFYNNVSMPNQFKSNSYSVEVFERFYNDWGTKQVVFVNTDERGIPVVLRISYNEIWANTTFRSNSSGGSSVNTSGSSTYENEAVKPDEYLSAAEYNHLTYASNTIDGQNVVIKSWTSEFSNDFILGDDGWYYYKKVLNPEESVQVLNSVNLNLELLKDSPYKNTYTNYDIIESNGNYSFRDPTDDISKNADPYYYNLVFSFESIQAKTSAIEDIWGKNVTIDGNDVEWNFD